MLKNGKKPVANILCCGFFPALQRTIEYNSFRPGEVNRARAVSVTASGKATNSARITNALGAQSTLLSFAGGANGKTIRDLLDTESFDCRWVETRAETRICQTLLSDDSEHCTELVENSPPVSAAEWKNFIHTFAALEAEFDRIIFSGNLPPHAPQEIYAELLSLTDGAKTLIDASGPPLSAALEHQPALIKINADELRSTLKSTAPVSELAGELIALGAGAVGITQGKDPALLVTPERTYTFQLPQIKVVNPIGSGDSVSAGTVCALAKGYPLPEAFLFGLACGCANTLNLEPGRVELTQVAELAPQIKIGHD